MDRYTLRVPRLDRTMLRLRSAVQLGLFALINGPSNSARRRAARPHRLSRLWASRVWARQGWAGEKVPSLSACSRSILAQSERRKEQT